MGKVIANLDASGDQPVTQGENSFWRKLERILDRRVAEAADDPRFISTLDETSLRLHGYDEKQINQIKEAGSFLV